MRNKNDATIWRDGKNSIILRHFRLKMAKKAQDLAEIPMDLQQNARFFVAY